MSRCGISHLLSVKFLSDLRKVHMWCRNVRNCSNCSNHGFVTESNMCVARAVNPSLSKSDVCRVHVCNFCCLHSPQICQHLPLVQCAAFKICRFCNMRSYQISEHLAVTFCWPHIRRETFVLFRNTMFCSKT